MPLPQPTIQYDPQQSDVLGKVGRVMSLRNLAQAGRLQQEQLTAAEQENQARSLQLKSTQATMRAFTDAQGDPEKTVALAAQYGADPQHVIALKNSFLDQQQKLATLTKDQLANADKQADMIGNAAQAVLALPPEQRRAGIVKALGDFTAQQAIPMQQAQQLLSTVPDDPAGQEQWLKFHAASAMAAKDQIAQIRQQQEDAETQRHNRAMEARQPVTEAALALRSQQGDATAEAALKRLDKSKLASRPNVNIMTGNDAKDIADAIENGDQPPTLQGLYRNAGPVRAELARRGFPLAKAETDWKATQKYISTLNGPQQTRLRQAISTASDSLNKIEDLYAQLQKATPTGGFKSWNRAVLASAKQLPGQAGALATNLDAQIADFTSELGNVLMGGNSPTDHALNLAGKQLSGDWNKQTFEEAIKQARLNIRIRNNSIIHGAPAGMSGESNYFQQTQPEKPQPSAVVYARDPQGKLHQAPAGTALPQGWKLENH